MADNNIAKTQADNAAYAKANPNVFGAPAPTTSTAPVLANGQTAGSPQTGLQMPTGAASQSTFDPATGQQTPTAPTGLQMPAGQQTPAPAQTPPTGIQMPANGSNLVFDPTTGTQVTPAEKAFNATQASGKTAPQDSSSASGTVKTAIDNATPANPAATTTPNVDNFYDTNKTIQQNAQDLQNFFSPPAQQQQLQDQLTKITTDQATLAGLNTQMMNVKNIMKGTEDDIRHEIQAVGGMATNSQILALTTARNKTLLQQSTLIQNSIDTASTAISNDMSLLTQEKEMAQNQFAQRTTTYKMAQDNYNSMITAQKDSANTIIQAIGYKGYLDNLQAQGPTAVANAEKALGLGAGGLQNLVTQQQQQQNANAIANSGATTPFINKNGEIQSQTGYAYTSEQDFFNKTGMTIQQANAKGMVSALQPSLDIQQKKANLEKTQSDLAMAPLDRQLKQAQIANTFSEIAKRNSDAKKAALGGDTVSGLAQQLVNGMLAPSELSKRSTGVGSMNDILNQADQLSMATTGKHFNIAQADRNYKFANQPATQNTLNYLGSLVGSPTQPGNLDALKTQSNSIKRTDFPAINDVQQWAKIQTGDPAITAYYATVTEVADQVAKILQGGGTGSGTSDAKLAQAQALFQGKFSAKQINATVDAIKPLLMNRAQSMVKDNPYLSDYAQQFGFQQQTAQSQVPQGAPPSGQVWVLDKASGQYGSIPTNEYDPSKYNKIGQ